VHGDLALGDALWREGFDLARGEAGFAKLLAEAAGAVERGLTLFGGLRTTQGRIDLKRAGLFGIVTTARVLAIRHHVVERSTAARLGGVAALGIGGEADLTDLVEAHLPRSHPGAADRGHRARPSGEQPRRHPAAVAGQPRPAAPGAGRGPASRRPDARPLVPHLTGRRFVHTPAGQAGSRPCHSAGSDAR
jgi:hypothetical protein